MSKRADFILELYSEEIPAGMQARAAADLARALGDILSQNGVELNNPDALKTYFAPQRLAVMISDLPVRTSAQKIEKKGPKLDAPEKAIEGFLRANGLENTDGLRVESHPKGDFYILENTQKGRALADIFAAALPDVIAGFSWPKSMRWGRGKLRWVRPLRAILCRFNGEIVPFEIDGLRADGHTYGHRFMAPDAIEIKQPQDYVSLLEKAYVQVDPQLRRADIVRQAQDLAKAQGLELVEDAALEMETTGLVEWPVCLMGRIDDAFMEVPDEVLTSVMRTHQKYFTVQDSQTGKLAPYFITVANMVTKDKGAAIINGNERVLRARLADGKFFWDKDRETSLQDRLPELEKIVFHAKLGSVREKTQRMASLAQGIAAQMGAKPDVAGQAAELSKADLVSGMVYEFPELQGIMGGYYADNAELGVAIRDHYKPLGPSDAIPETREGCVVALADKIDTLTGFWSIDEKPTGSKDPYALRRAALGVIRILVETSSRLSLSDLFEKGFGAHGQKDSHALTQSLADFVGRRLRVYLRDKENIAHDIVDAVFAQSADDVVDLVARAKALAGFLAGDDGQNLLAAFRRAHGILSKSDHKSGAIDKSLLRDKAEKELHQAIETIKTVDIGDYDSFAAYLDNLSTLRAPVDAFFENVMVNDEDAEIRQNRFNLLVALVDKMQFAARFDCIE